MLPFLNIGFICENFKHEGNKPVDNDLLHIYVSADIIKNMLNKIYATEYYSCEQVFFISIEMPQT